MSGSVRNVGYRIHDLVINQSSIHKCRTKLRIQSAEKVKNQFCNNLLHFAVMR